MKVVALVSGGKDSCYAMMKCVQYGHEIVALANLMPSNDSVDELDSYMYQTVGHQIVVNYAKCMGLPLFRRRIQGSTRHQKLGYKMTPGDEVEDMFILLSEIKRKIPSITAVSSGAISSDYQRLRVESVCSRLGLVSLAYLWKQDQAFLLQEMITNGIKAITVKVASLGLDPAKHLGKEISYLKPYLHKLEEKYGINICGEGGEYETLTLDCPLFLYAQILLDEFKVVLHSSDSIAPVGILHPLAFRLGNKKGFVSSSIDGVIDEGSISNDLDLEKMGSVCEVQGDCLKIYVPSPQPIQEVSVELTKNKVCMSRTKGENTFSLCCWLQNSCSTSTGLQEDLGLVLRKLELQLLDSGFGWEHVLYVHLYIADMNEFTLANETYVNFITEEKCHYGVPSRSTIELPLHCTGLGHAYVEVLVARDTSKRVLHVQSISSWAPSCIGPYSQATLQKEILHMAGQLGLEPSTMCLCKGGPSAELDQALKNSEAVAKCFNCSISTSAIQFSIYCSTHVPLTTRIKIQERHEMFLDQRRCLQLEGSKSKVLKPISLFFLVPDLPKRAFVEVKPILYVEPDAEITFEDHAQHHSCTTRPSYWGFHPENWQDSCFQKCIVHGSICAVVINITNELALKIFSVSSSNNQKGGVCESLTTHGELEIIARYCVYLLDKVLLENEFSWQDAVILRIYFPTRLGMHVETLYDIFSSAFIAIDDSPIFSLVPVLGAGRSAAALDDLITCELFAQKGEFSV